MLTFHRMGLSSCALLGAAFLAMGCLGDVSRGEKTTHDALVNDKPSDPANTPNNPPDKPPADPNPNTCVDGDLGDGVACQDTAAFEQAATDACTASGLVLIGVKAIQDCPGGQSTKATYECCQSQPPQNQCIDGALGDRVTCQAPSVLEQQAADACSAAGLSLMGVKLVGDCPGGQSTEGQYICCPARPPAP